MSANKEENSICQREESPLSKVYSTLSHCEAPLGPMNVKKERSMDFWNQTKSVYFSNHNHQTIIDLHACVALNYWLGVRALEINVMYIFWEMSLFLALKIKKTKP